ncbi:unnamed protein product [Hyaloperonospora brassicae]|uniref:C2 domain-containing protein n=1 Tax=Hyaloperonospora brassicae TaxID=162125 RepID=A0AAV0TKM3_HYABA|nr:unnamed protein product [Hyaloperonospora brassicae]
MGQVTSAAVVALTALALSPSAHAWKPRSALDVELEIVSAADIAAGDRLDWKASLKGQFSSSDAFAAIEVMNETVAWTRPIASSLNPEWDEKFYFRNVEPDTSCKLYLMDKDLFSDDALGEAEFIAVDTHGKEKTFELPITHEAKSAGTITVKLKSHSTSTKGDGKLLQYGPVHYAVHSSFVGGVLTQTRTDDDKLRFLAYHMYLHDISVHLPTDIEWNRNYPTIRRIFASDHLEAPAMRKMVQSEHDYVYKHNGNTVYGELDEADDFFKLLHGGKRQDQSVLYTYVVVETGMYFSETGAAFFKDMLSKHMLHSRAQYHVKYAGEFYISKGHFGKYTLHIDNNSGTYSPPEKKVAAAQGAAREQFPGD